MSAHHIVTSIIFTIIIDEQTIHELQVSASVSALTIDNDLAVVAHQGENSNELPSSHDTIMQTDLGFTELGENLSVSF